MQRASQSALQSASQLGNCPPLHEPMHLPSQSALQLASIVTLHCPSHASVKLMGVHSTSQPPDVTSSQSRLPLESNWKPPHGSSAKAAVETSKEAQANEAIN